jgi:uncharacterized protein YaaN involved in tellurite resistance
MIKQINSSIELIKFINSFPISQEDKHSVNILQDSLSNMDDSKYDSNYINGIRDKIFDNLEKILNDFFSKDEKIDSFKKDNNIDRIIISISEKNNTLYATV